MERAGRNPGLALQQSKQLGQRRHLFGYDHLGQRDHEPLRQAAPALFRQRGDEVIEGAETTLAKLLAERLDANAEEGGQRPGLEPAGDLLGGRGRVAVLLGLGAIAVAVLEIDAKILDRLALELLDDAPVDGVREPGRRIAPAHRVGVGGEIGGERADGLGRLRQLLGSGQPERAGENCEVGVVLAQAAKRQVPHLARGVGLEQVGSAVHGVNRLPLAAFTRVGGGEGEIGGLEPGQRLANRIRLERVRHESLFRELTTAHRELCDPPRRRRV